jgi:hypothetical protein
VKDLKRESGASSTAAVSKSSLALFGSSSVVTGGGGLIAEMAGHVETAALIGIYGSAGLIAVVGSIAAIVKILAERSPEIRKASALAKIAKKRARQDGGALLLLDRSLDKEGITADQVVKALNPSSSGEQSGSREDADGPPNPSKTGGNVRSIYIQDKEGRALSVFTRSGLRHIYGVNGSANSF